MLGWGGLIFQEVSPVVIRTEQGNVMESEWGTTLRGVIRKELFEEVIHKPRYIRQEGIIWMPILGKSSSINQQESRTILPGCEGSSWAAELAVWLRLREAERE